MNLKYALFLLTFIVATTTATAQKIKIKKKTVYVDGEKCLEIGGDANNVSFYNLYDEEIIFLKFTEKPKIGDYTKITFLKQNLSFTSQSYAFTRKNLIKKLIEDRTLKNCQLNDEKVKNFVLKYDEEIEKEQVKVEVKITN